MCTWTAQQTSKAVGWLASWDPLTIASRTPLSLHEPRFIHVMDSWRMVATETQAKYGVWAMATHGVLSGPAVDRLKNAPLERLILTNTLPLPPEKQLPQIEVLSVAEIIAEALSAVFDDTSVSEIFGGENLA